MSILQPTPALACRVGTSTRLAIPNRMPLLACWLFCIILHSTHNTHHQHIWHLRSIIVSKVQSTKYDLRPAVCTVKTLTSLVMRPNPLYDIFCSYWCAKSQVVFCTETALLEETLPLHRIYNDMVVTEMRQSASDGEITVSEMNLSLN